MKSSERWKQPQPFEHIFSETKSEGKSKQTISEISETETETTDGTYDIRSEPVINTIKL